MGIQFPPTTILYYLYFFFLDWYEVLLNLLNLNYNNNMYGNISLQPKKFK
jgi:hypothetical protein